MTDTWLAEFNEDVGERVRHHRKRQRQTQQAVADAVGVSRSTIANIEVGRQRVPVDVLWRVAVVVGVPFGKVVPEPARSAP